MAQRDKAPAVSYDMDIEFTMPEVITLPNGMKLMVVGDGEDDVNKLSIYVPGGCYEESSPLLAEITASAIFEGNAKQDAVTVAEQLDYLGTLRQQSSFDHRCGIVLSSLNSSFAKTCDILLQSLSTPTFPNRQVEVITHSMASYVRNQLKRVRTLAENEMYRIYYGPEHPFSRSATGESVKAITCEDAKQFHHYFYSAKDTVITLAGHITDDELKTLEQTLGQWQTPVANCPLLEDIVPHRTNKKIGVITQSDAVQSAIKIRVQTPPRPHPDYLPIRILVMALGGYFGSRLMKNIREEKGLTYGISATLSGRNYEGHIDIDTECATAYTWQVIDEVKREMERLQNEPIGNNELFIVKQHMMSTLAKILDTPFSRAEYASNVFTNGFSPDYYNAQVHTIRTITPSILQEMAVSYLNPDDMIVTIAGNIEL